MTTWNELENVLQETLQAIADGKIIFNPNGQKLQALGLVDMMPARLTLYPGRDFRLTPAGRECLASALTGETPASRALLPAGEAVDDESDVSGITEPRFLEIMRLRKELAAALARAQAAEALLKPFGYAWRSWMNAADRRMGFNDWLHEWMGDDYEDKFEAADKYIKAQYQDSLK